jgi:cell division protein FtsB
MHEPLLDRIRDLERSNRRWKAACAVLAAALLAVLTSGVAWVGVYGYQALSGRQEALRAAEQARMQELRARAEAEAARQQALEALEKAQRVGEQK